MEKRFKFHDLFLESPDGRLSPKVTMRANGSTFSPGVSFLPGVSFGGIDFHQYKGMDVAASEEGGILEIAGFYRPSALSISN